MKKKNKKAKPITKRKQLRVRTGVKSGTNECYRLFGDCPSPNEVCIDGTCIVI